MAIPFNIPKKALPPEFGQALEVNPQRPDAELHHVQVLGFGTCTHDGAPFVIQAIDRASQCVVCNRRYVFESLQVQAHPDGRIEMNVSLRTLAPDADHPIRTPPRN